MPDLCPKSERVNDGQKRTSGTNLLKRPHIKAEIERRRTELLQNSIASSERVLRAYEAQAFLNPTRLYDEQNRIKPMSELDDETAFAVSKIKLKTGVAQGGEVGEIAEIEVDRNAALAGICSMLGYKRPPQVDVQVSGTVSIEAVREVLERAFAPVRDDEVPEVIPIEQVTTTLTIAIEPPPLPDSFFDPDAVPENPVKSLPVFDLAAARAALKDEEE